jgi:hypothetical protein
VNDSNTLPEWMREALRAPIDAADGEAHTAATAVATARIMRQVRTVPPPRRRSLPPMLQTLSRWRRRGALSGLGGACVSALLALMLTVHHGDEIAWQRAAQAHALAQALVAGDSVVPTSGDSLVARVGERLLDTLHIVDLVLRGPAMGRANISVADARVQATLVRTSVGASEWHARALVPRDMVALAVVVNGATHALPLRSSSLPTP